LKYILFTYEEKENLSQIITKYLNPDLLTKQKSSLPEVILNIFKYALYRYESKYKSQIIENLLFSVVFLELVPQSMLM